MNDIKKIKELLLKKDYDKLKNFNYNNLEDIFSSNILNDMDKIIVFLINIKNYDNQEDFFNDKISYIYSEIDDNFYNMKQILMKNYSYTYQLLEKKYLKEKIKMIFDLETGIDDNFFLNLPTKYSEFIEYYSGENDQVFDKIFHNPIFRKILFDEDKLNDPYLRSERQLYNNFFTIKENNINNKKINYFLNLDKNELYTIAYLQIDNKKNLNYYLSKIFNKYYEHTSSYSKEYVINIWNNLDITPKKILLKWFENNTINEKINNINTIIKYYNNDKKIINKIITFIYNYPNLVNCITQTTLNSRDKKILNWLIKMPALKNKPSNLEEAYMYLSKEVININDKKKFSNVSPLGTRSGVFFDYTHEVMIISPNGFIETLNAENSHDLLIRNYFSMVIDKIDNNISNVDLASYLASTGKIILVIEKNMALVYLPNKISSNCKKAFIKKMNSLGIDTNKNIFFAVLQTLEDRDFFDKEGNMNVPNKVDSYIYNNGDTINYDELINYLNFIDNKKIKISR